MNDCIFCKIVSGEIPALKVHETAEVLAFADISPINLGHTLVIPKEHHATLFDIPVDLLSLMTRQMQIVAQKVKTGTSANGINIGMNNYRAAGQIVDHAHIHVIPRFENDGHKHWHGKEYSKEQITEVAEKIANA